MILHTQISSYELKKQVRQQLICFAGNKKLHIYGTLHCSTGKRMKKANRVFFTSTQEAIEKGFRPCGHCMHNAYKKWKHEPLHQ